MIERRENLPTTSNEMRMNGAESQYTRDESEISHTQKKKKEKLSPVYSGQVSVSLVNFLSTSTRHPRVDGTEMRRKRANEGVWESALGSSQSNESESDSTERGKGSDE